MNPSGNYARLFWRKRELCFNEGFSETSFQSFSMIGSEKKFVFSYINRATGKRVDLTFLSLYNSQESNAKSTTMYTSFMIFFLCETVFTFYCPVWNEE